MMSNTFSPCHTRSGSIYKPLDISDNTSESEDDAVDTDHSEEEVVTKDHLPLEHFDDQLSPIRRQQSKPSLTSPAFLIRRRERTSTRVVQNTPKEKKNLVTTKNRKSNINPYE